MSSSLRPARIEDLEALSALCLRSKAHWGYDAAFMAAWGQELTLTPLGPHPERSRRIKGRASREPASSFDKLRMRL